MTLWNRLRFWLVAILGRSRIESEMDAELRFHLEKCAEDLVRQGVPRDEALRRARIEFGCIEGTKEECRDARGTSFIESLVQDIRFGLRMLHKNAGFTTVAVFTLALGIGTNSAIFSVTYAILLKPLSYVDPNSLVTISNFPRGSNDGYNLSLPIILDLQSNNRSFEQVTGRDSRSFWLIGYGAPETLHAGRIMGNFFATFGVHPLLGRPILPADTLPERSKVTVMSFDLWRTHFGSDPGIVGRKVVLTETSGPEEFDVIGVMPPGFYFSGYNQQKFDLWIPLALTPSQRIARGESDKFVVARLRKGVTLAQANAELGALNINLQAYPGDEEGHTLKAERLHDLAVKNAGTALLVLLGAAWFVLLITCVNVSSLVLDRTWTRMKEVAVRRALGASGLRIMRQFLLENALVSLAGGALGLLLAIWSVGVLRAMAPKNTPRLEELHLYPAVFWYSLGITFGISVLLGLVPTFQVSGAELDPALKKTGMMRIPRFETKLPNRMRGALIVAEVALTLVLLSASILALRSFARLTAVPLGLRTDHVLTMDVSLSPSACIRGDACAANFDRILDSVRSLHGVESDALSNFTPLEGMVGFWGGDLLVEQRPPQPTAERKNVLVQQVETGPGYFRTVGIQFLCGREFTSTDQSGAIPVAIVNETFARRFLSEKPIGRHIALGPSESRQPDWIEIIGEVSDARDVEPSRDPQAELYFPMLRKDASPSATFLVRTTADPLPLSAAVRERIWAVDKNAPVTGLKTMSKAVSERVGEPRFRTALLGSFGALGLALTMIGIYGVISYRVSQNTREIGVRVALGARRGDILRLVVGNGMLLVFEGIAIGVSCALGLTRFLRSLLFEITPTDPLTFASVVVLVAVVAIAACYVPARRATQVDPVVALRYE